MTNSASQATRAPFEHSTGLSAGINRNPAVAGYSYHRGKEPRWFMEQLEQARLNSGGWGAVAKNCG